MVLESFVQSFVLIAKNAYLCLQVTVVDKTYSYVASQLSILHVKNLNVISIKIT